PVGWARAETDPVGPVPSSAAYLAHQTKSCREKVECTYITGSSSASQLAKQSNELNVTPLTRPLPRPAHAVPAGWPQAVALELTHTAPLPREMTQTRIRAGLPSGLTAPSTALVAQVPALAALTEKRPRSPVAVLRLSTRRQPAGCKPVLPGVSALGWVHRRPEPDVELTPRSATWAIAALMALAPPRSPASG